MNKRTFTGERLTLDSKLISPMRIENLARFNFFLKFAKGPNILDIGCGIGEGTTFVSKHMESQVIGIDSSKEALKIGNVEFGSGGAHFIQMDAEQLAFKQHCFDSIISIEVIEHVSNPSKFLGEARRVLKTGGLFILSTPNQLRSSPTLGSLWPEHKREFNPDELKKLLKKYFTNVDLWGEQIPIYENHPIRIIVRHLAPYFKPILPRMLRIRALPIVQNSIKANLKIDDVEFTQNNIQEMPTLIAICQS